MNQNRILWIIICCLLTGIRCSQKFNIDYLGLEPPGLEPKIFAPGIISNQRSVHNVAIFTPDGKYFFFNNARHGSIDYYWVDAKIIEELKPKL